MTQEIFLTLAILLAAIILFITEKIRVDLVALLVLVALVITGLITPAEGLSGFSNPAVVTVWAVFILSAGLSATGVAHIIGRQVLRISGSGEVRLVVVIMLTAAVLSGFMNNVGVAALLLPVTLMIARQTNIPPSRLLMPLATGCLLGGMTTLIGTPPNILASDALRDAGLEPFQFFDFAPTGIIITLAGVAFVVLIGRHLLPNRHPVQALALNGPEQQTPKDLYDLEERLALVEVPLDSPLAGKSLVESRIGLALGLTILGLQRHGRKRMNIRPETIVRGGDQLLALGRLDRLEELTHKPYLVLDETNELLKQLYSQETGLAEWIIEEDSGLIGQTISGIDVRRKFGFNVIAIRRRERIYRTSLQQIPLQAGDTLLIQGNRDELFAASERRLFTDGQLLLFDDESMSATDYELQERLLWVRIPADSPLDGRTLAESELDENFDLLALSIVRGEQVMLAPKPETELQANDLLLVEGKPEELAILRGLQGLVIKPELKMTKVELESERVGLVEAVLSPRTTLVSKSLREIRFREKYDLSVLAIWRKGRAYRSDLGDLPLEFGDAFLLYGPREKISVLVEEPDFIVLTEELEMPPRRSRAPLAILIMAAVIGIVLIGWLPIAIAAIAGAALMILTGCLPMDEAYRNIEWRAVFLIAGMLPLGIALEQSGAAQFLAEGMINLVGGMGAAALLAGLFILTSIASQFMPNPVVTVIMAPIALSTSADLSLNPQALMMVIAIAASAAFMSPVGHPANVLVMAPGGYRFSDYLKSGIPLTLVVLIVTLIIVPIIWPL